MPQNRKVIKSATGGITKFSVSAKHRIGTRSGGKSAHFMKSDELREILSNKDKSRYHNKARNVLQLRGAALTVTIAE